MNPLWDYLWPIFAAGVVIGALAGHLAFRQRRMAGASASTQQWRRTRNRYFGGGAAAALVATMLWSGPLGGGARLTGRIETSARATLDHLEMTQVSARLERAPLRRRLVLSGPADDFQRSEIKRMIEEQPGVEVATWGGGALPAEARP